MALNIYRGIGVAMAKLNFSIDGPDKKSVTQSTSISVWIALSIAVLLVVILVKFWVPF